MPADVNQLRAVIARADRHQELLSAALLKLEDRISDLMATAPLRDGDLFDLEWALAARVELREAIEQEYLATVDSIVREYAVVANEALVMLKTYGDVTKIDPAIISQLQSFTFQGFDDLGQNFLDAVSKELYESTLTGTSFANSLSTIKQSVDASLGRYAKQALHDGLMQFDASINTKLALMLVRLSLNTMAQMIQRLETFVKSMWARHIQKKRSRKSGLAVGQARLVAILLLYGAAITAVIDSEAFFKR